MDRLVRDRRAHDEPGHEVALGPDEGGHLRPTPDPGRGDRRRVLHLAADPQQVRVVAGQPDDPAVGRPGGVDQEVPVRDPARTAASGSARGRPAPGRAAWPPRARRSSSPRRALVVGHRSSMPGRGCGATIARRGARCLGLCRDRLTDHGLAGHRVGRLDVVGLAAHGRRRSRARRTRIVADDHLEHRPGRQALDRVAERREERSRSMGW